MLIVIPQFANRCELMEAILSEQRTEKQKEMRKARQARSASSSRAFLPRRVHYQYDFSVCITTYDFSVCITTYAFSRSSY